jgi:predicted methyltransferase
MNTHPRRAFLVLFAAFVLAAAVFALPQTSDDVKRDAWQRPGDVMDALDARAGSHVADVGCGHGYFVMHLARRVGADGIVYGVDVDGESLEKVRHNAEEAKLSNVRTIRSREDDPQLPAGELDGVLIVNAYHEMKQYDAMLRAILVALKPHGRLVIIDSPGKENISREEHQRNHSIPEATVREDAQRNGFHFVRKEPDVEPNREDRSRGAWFFLIFEKPEE